MTQARLLGADPFLGALRVLGRVQTCQRGGVVYYVGEGAEMTRFHKISIAILFAALVAGVAMAETGRSSCVYWNSEAHHTGWGYYSHVVHLESKCSNTMRCDVFTDANPQVQSIELRSEERRSITTSVSSRWQSFRTTVDCEKIY